MKIKRSCIHCQDNVLLLSPSKDPFLYQHVLNKGKSCLCADLRRCLLLSLHVQMYHHLAIVLGICGIASSSADKQPNKTKTELQTMQYPFHYMLFL